MVRTKSSEQAKRLAAKQAARKAKAPPDEPAQPDSFLAQMLRDRRAAAEQPETAEEAARAETIAQTRLGAVMAATLCRTNFTQGLQGNSKAVVELLGEGSLVPRKDWFGCIVPDGVRERERERFEIKDPKLPCPLRPVAPEPVATEPAPNPLDAPAPLTAAPAGRAAAGDGARVPPTAEERAGHDEGAGHDERRAPAAPAAPAASAPGSSADHVAPPPRPPPKGAGGSGDAAAEEPQEEPRFVLPAGSLRPKWACGGELGLCPGCVECIEDHPDRPRTDDDGRPEPLHSNPGNEAALPLEPNSGPLHLAELVEVVGELEENASFLARRGYALEWHAGQGVYEVLFEEHDERVLIRPVNLLRARSVDYNGYGYVFNPLPEDLNLKEVPEPSSNRKPMDYMIAMLANLIPVTEEQPAEQGTTRKEVDAEEWAQVPEDQPIADISLVDTSDENKLVWMQCLPMPIKRVASRLLDLGRLTWDDLLEDGIFFWEIGFTERPEWIERDRWHQTVCNFLLLMAWERTIHPHAALYPTARLQMLRELFYGEWAMRTHRLGLQLWPIYFKEEAEAEAAEAAAAGEPSQLSRVRALADDLSAYEHQRNANIADNQRKLRELFGADAPHLVKKKSAPRRAPAAAAPRAEPSRSSGRVSSKAPVSYAPTKRARGGSDDDESSDDEDESGEEYERSDADSSSGDEACTDDDDDDEEEGGGAKARGKAKARGGKAKAKPRPKPAKGGAAASSSSGGGKARKKVQSRGASASVPAGGDGFECPAPGCTSVFDTAEEALEHGATHGLSGEREVDAEGKTCCLWQGCGKKAKVIRPSAPNQPHFSNLRAHEALHVKGPKPREGFVCPECDEAHPTAAAAWACAATHGVEEDDKKCLWAGCGLVFARPADYRAHEPVHTGVWPYHCTTCHKGFKHHSMATLCCKVTAACKCGWSMKGHNGPQKFKKHKARCSRGAALELLD